MKQNLLKCYLLGFFLFSDFILFAQPGDEDTNGGLEGNDPVATPINGKILWLAILGIAFAMHTFYKNRKRA